MTVVDTGHTYLLQVLDGESKASILRFVKRKGDKYPGNEDSYPGTTLQEVLRACCERVRYVDNQIPCEENRGVLGHLRECIHLLEVRAAKRHGRSSLIELDEAEFDKLCKKCNHVGCKGECH